jgi:hypothetical protein
MKKNMTIDDLAALMIKTMASKEDLGKMATKVDLKDVKTSLTNRLDDLHIEVQKIDNKIKPG